MRNLRIIFMGTPDFAVPSLEKLNENFNIVGVITSPDRKSGRGQKVSFSAVKQSAIDLGIPVLQPTNLKAEDFHKELEDLNANLQIVVAFRMLPKIVWQMPEFGTINLHGSLLPQYRGAAPINWAVINGEKETGVTTFFIEEKIDTGNIIQQETIHIDPDENAGELHDKMMIIGADLLVETAKMIEIDDISVKKQEEFFSEAIQLKPAPKIFKETCEINFNQPALKVHDFIRGLSPYPSAWTKIKDLNFKIYKGKITDKSCKTPGDIITDQSEFIRIACQDFYYEILELQMPGKKRMTVKDFLRGNADEIS